LGFEVMLGVIVLILYVLCAQWIDNTKFQYIHESSIAIILGILGGLIVYIVDHKLIEFDTSVFFYFVLPPIIFSAGYNLRTNEFVDNFGYIALYGFLGTFISFISLSLLGVFFSQSGALAADSQLSTRDTLLLACVLSATDTVAAVSVVKESKYPKLNSILFGEGVINDAVSIVLFRAVLAIGQDGLGTMEVLEMLWNFVYMCSMSVFVGASLGLLCALLLKHIPKMSEHPERETAVIIMVGYLSYILAEVIDLSGIMTIFCCGVTMARYAWHNISTESQRGTSLVFTVMAQAAEAFTYTYLGLSVFTLNKGDWELLFMVCMLLSVLISRAASILISSGLVYCIQKFSFGLNSQYICVIWYSGVIRGAVAFAMSLQITSNHSTVLRSTTMGIVLITTLILSNLLGALTQFLGLKPASTNSIYLELIPPVRKANRDPDSKDTWLNKTWSKLDNSYLKPIFGGDHPGESKNQNTVWDHLWSDEDNETKS